MTERINIALPELAIEKPTLPLTTGIYFGRRSYWTVASLMVLLVDGLGRMTTGDLERLIKLGDDAYMELSSRERENHS